MTKSNVSGKVEVPFVSDQVAAKDYLVSWYDTSTGTGQAVKNGLLHSLERKGKTVVATPLKKGVVDSSKEPEVIPIL